MNRLEVLTVSDFGIRHWSFFRHSGFVIRHSGRRSFLQSVCRHVIFESLELETSLCRSVAVDDVRERAG